MKVWIVGIKGSVATTAIAGVIASRRYNLPKFGMLTETEDFNNLYLVSLEELEFGGHEIRDVSLLDAVRHNVVENGYLSLDIVNDIKKDLNDIEVHLGTVINCGDFITRMASEKCKGATSIREIEERITNDILEFKRSDDCVMINLASAEPHFDIMPEHKTLESFESGLDKDLKWIPASSLYAYCAIKNNIPYINFTSSLGNDIPALKELAVEKNVPHYGKDGKTGETLVKAALAPMFKYRNLRVEGWTGYNVLGGFNGEVLSKEENVIDTTKDKARVINNCLGYNIYSTTDIIYYPPVKNKKVAWDLINFRGFLGYPMSMHFTWEGADSILAAPLVIDLIRLSHFAKKKKIGGLLKPFAFYFKHPIECDIGNLHEQCQMLINWIKSYK